MGTLNPAESHSSQNEGSVHRWQACPLPTQLLSRPESSSPKFAHRLPMLLLARRVLPPGGLTWLTASTPLSSELVMLVSNLVFARRAPASSVTGPATTHGHHDPRCRVHE